MERRVLVTQARQRLAASCTLQLVFISFSLTPLFSATLASYTLQLICEAYYPLLLTCSALAAGTIFCILHMLRCAVSSVMRLIGWARRGLLRSARELTGRVVLDAV